LDEDKKKRIKTSVLNKINSWMSNADVIRNEKIDEMFPAGKIHQLKTANSQKE
jgi:hypothetical protein